jgi:hypothetical protein
MGKRDVHVVCQMKQYTALQSHRRKDNIKVKIRLRLKGFEIMVWKHWTFMDILMNLQIK